MTYVAALLYILGMVQTDDMISMVMSAPGRRRFSPGVEKAARALVLVLWPAFPIWVGIKMIEKGWPR